MKTDPKIASGAHAEAASWGGLFRVAIVGAASLKGRELKDVLTERNFPSHDVRLLDDDESLGQLEAVGDEPTFIQSVLPEHMDNVDFTFFASDPQFTRDTWSYAKKAGSDIIDLSYYATGSVDRTRDRQSSARRSWKRTYTGRPPCSHGISALAVARRQGR
jgi:hypothetical protein